MCIPITLSAKLHPCDLSAVMSKRAQIQSVPSAKRGPAGIKAKYRVSHCYHEDFKIVK